ncbi:MAG: FGGY family carbohydrate kinase, partial [Actinocatenispora sp.]
MTAATVAGVDIGTTHLRVGLWSADGRPAFLASRPTPYRPGFDGLRGVDVLAATALVAELLGDAVDAVGAPPVSVGIASIAEVGVPLDARQLPLAPGIPWTRAPGAAEVDGLLDRLGGAHLYRVTGLRAEPKHTLATWLWLRRRQPELLTAMHRWAGVADAVAAALTGTVSTVASLACRTLAFDLDRGDWSADLLAEAGLT